MANPGVDATAKGGSEADAALGIESLISAIGGNTTLEKVRVNVDFTNVPQFQVMNALEDTEGRRRGRTGPLTKAHLTGEVHNIG
jgi:hypothetical protein